MEKKADKTEAAKTRKDALSDDRRKLLSAMMEKEAAEKQAADLQAAGIQAAQGQAGGQETPGGNPFTTPGGNPGPGTPPGQSPGQSPGQGPNFGGPGAPPGMENTGPDNPAGGFPNPFGGNGFQPGMMQNMMQGMAAGQMPGQMPGQNPGMGQGPMPGMMPGMNPGMMGGMMPGFGQGMGPGFNPMSQMFGQPGNFAQPGNFGQPGQPPFGGFNPMNFSGMGVQGQGGNTQAGKNGARKEEGAKAPSPLVAIKASGSRPPFFCVHAILGSVFPYHNLALHMEKDQPFYGLQSTAVDGKTDSSETIEGMAEAYLTAIREVQPKGPYYLGGYSFGG
ncbi:MAG: thioesterase domain-containing protein, partial [Desulfobacterales bacterium]|nr:thioesterase domain-containing protein [Desulfobacterales bacterium]